MKVEKTVEDPSNRDRRGRRNHLALKDRRCQYHDKFAVEEILKEIVKVKDPGGQKDRRSLRYGRG